MSEHKMPKIGLGAVTDGDGNDLEGHAYITSCDEGAELEITVEGVQAHAVAPLFVRACNSHDALVKALEQAVSYFGWPTDGWSGIRDDDTLQLTANVRAGDLKSMIAALHLAREGGSNAE